MKMYDIIEYKDNGMTKRGMVIGIKEVPSCIDLLQLSSSTDIFYIIRDEDNKIHELHDYCVKKTNIKSLSEYTKDELLKELESRINVFSMSRDNVVTLIFK